jgi:hypothetical protein
MNLQLAFYMGFSEVYLIGMDFSYAVPQSTTIEGANYTSNEDDPNHFHPEYFGKGKKWHDPMLDRVAMNYEKAKEAFGADGRTIYNATVGGKLEIFPRTEYASLFESSRTKPVNLPGMLTDSELVTGGQPQADNPLSRSTGQPSGMTHTFLNFVRFSRAWFFGGWKPGTVLGAAIVLLVAGLLTESFVSWICLAGSAGLLIMLFGIATLRFLHNRITRIVSETRAYAQSEADRRTRQLEREIVELRKQINALQKQKATDREAINH